MERGRVHVNVRQCGQWAVRISGHKQARSGSIQQLMDLVSSLRRLRLHGGLIVRVAEILSVSADELLGLTEAKNASKRANGAKNRRLLRRIEQIETLPKRDQEALLRTIDAFLSKSAA